MIKIGIIGCGNISKFHIPALQKVGFSIVAISGRDGSENKLEKFSIDNNLTDSKTFSSSLELIHSNLWDALLVCCPTENSLEYLNIACKYKKPILVEKPISFLSSDLENLIDYKNIMVGFNRRHYSNISQIKSFMQSKSNVFVKVSKRNSSF